MLSDSKKQLDITLTEPVLFLRSSDPTGQLEPDSNDSPTLVRGILNLHVVKPIGISSIEVELAGVLSLRPPDERSSRIDIPETLRIYSSAVTVFRADQVPRGRRPASVGPGLSTTNSSSSDGRAVTTLPRPPPSPRRRSERRSSVSVPPDLGPTPPYAFVAQSPTPIQSRLGNPVENPGQTLEELGHALMSISEGQTHRNGSGEQILPPSSRPHSIEFSLSNPTDASSNSNDSLLRENDDHTNGMAHTGPPSEGGTSFSNATEEPPHILFPPSRPSRAHSLGNTHGAQPHTRVNSRDSSITPAGRSRLHISLSSVLDAVMEVTSRAPSMSQSVAEERGRGRTRARIAAEEQSREGNLEAGEGVADTGDGSRLVGNVSHTSRHVEHREHHLLGLGRVLGLERSHEEKDGEHKSKEHGEGWREFKPGTYSYPISFLLPPNLPPTLYVPHGSIGYTIKAVAHRPGAFTSKLSCQVPLVVVAAPTTGAGEDGGDPGPLIVQKQWEGKLAYCIGLSSRLFILGSRHHLETAASAGVRANTEPLVQAEVEARADATYGTVTLDLTLLPLDKIKIWRLSVVVDQRIRYIDERGKLFRDDTMQVKLLELEDTCLAEDLVDEEETHKNKHRQRHGFTRIPLLPTPISPHRSPLLRHVPPSTDPSVLAGPGPYTLSISIGLPSCNDPSSDACGLHFTVKQKSSSVKVEHCLRFVMRTEWVGDEGTSDHGDTKKLVDIAIQTPITILSCRCVPEYQTLPRYSEITEDGLQSTDDCACQPSVVRRHGREVETHLERAMISNLESEDGTRHVYHQADEQRRGREHSRSSSRAHRSGQMSPLTTTPPHLYPPPESPTSGAPSELGRHRYAAHAETHSRGQHHHHNSRYPSYSASTSHVRAHSSETPISTPRESRPPSPLAQYERLVSGLESDAGDAPPSYESIASGI